MWKPIPAWPRETWHLHVTHVVSGTLCFCQVPWLPDKANPALWLERWANPSGQLSGGGHPISHSKQSPGSQAVLPCLVKTRQPVHVCGPQNQRHSHHLGLFWLWSSPLPDSKCFLPASCLCGVVQSCWHYLKRRQESAGDEQRTPAIFPQTRKSNSLSVNYGFPVSSPITEGKTKAPGSKMTTRELDMS